MKCDLCGSALENIRAICNCGKDPYAGWMLEERYQVLGRVAQGGMGLLYRALILEDDRLCALKLSRWGQALQETRNMSPETAKKEEGARIEREFSLLKKAASQSQHIVQVYDQCRYDNRLGYYYPMEFLQGKPLSDHKDWGKPFSPARMLTLTLQLCEAVGIAHGLGVVHRDLNPDNLFIIEDPDGKEFVKLIDFGIARDLYSRKKLFQTGDDLAFGHFQYLSPEQVGFSPDSGGYDSDVAARLDHRADIYSIGALMFEMLSGEALFSENTLEGLANRDWEDLQKLEDALNDGTLPGELYELLCSCLDPDPELRPSDSYTLSAMLTSLLDIFDENSASNKEQRLEAPSDFVSSLTLALEDELSDLSDLANVIGSGEHTNLDSTSSSIYLKDDAHSSLDSTSAPVYLKSELSTPLQNLLTVEGTTNQRAHTPSRQFSLEAQSLEDLQAPSDSQDLDKPRSLEDFLGFDDPIIEVDPMHSSNDEVSDFIITNDDDSDFAIDTGSVEQNPDNIDDDPTLFDNIANHPDLLASRLNSAPKGQESILDADFGQEESEINLAQMHQPSQKHQPYRTERSLQRAEAPWEQTKGEEASRSEEHAHLVRIGDSGILPAPNNSYVTPYLPDPASSDQVPYSQAGLTPAPYSQAGLTPAPYSQAGLTPAPYSQAGLTPAPYSQAGLAPAPYSQAGLTPAPYSQAGLTPAPYSQAGFTPAPYSQAGLTPAPYSQAGLHSANGYPHQTPPPKSMGSSYSSPSNPYITRNASEDESLSAWIPMILLGFFFFLLCGGLVLFLFSFKM